MFVHVGVVPSGIASSGVTSGVSGVESSGVTSGVSGVESSGVTSGVTSGVESSGVTSGVTSGVESSVVVPLVLLLPPPQKQHMSLDAKSSSSYVPHHEVWPSYSAQPSPHGSTAPLSVSVHVTAGTVSSGVTSGVLSSGVTSGVVSSGVTSGVVSSGIAGIHPLMNLVHASLHYDWLTV